jgi:hypothetical protein
LAITEEKSNLIVRLVSPYHAGGTVHILPCALDSRGDRTGPVLLWPWGPEREPRVSAAAGVVGGKEQPAIIVYDDGYNIIGYVPYPHYADGTVQLLLSALDSRGDRTTPVLSSP